MRWRALIPKAVRRRLLRWFGKTTPTNWRRGSYQCGEIRRDVDQALAAGRHYVEWLGDRIDLAGKAVLELGPGIHFGPALYLTAHGARVTVADRFLAPWNPHYHPHFYEHLLHRLRDEEPHLDASALAAIVRRGSYPPAVLRLERTGLENLALDSGSIDITISNAVLEHLRDHARSFAELARVTRSGGWGFHQVDFRFHPHFDRPLDHLLLADADFADLAERNYQECGTTLRPFQMTALFQESGFSAVDFHASDVVAEGYFQGFLARLRRQPHLRHAPTLAELLQPIGGRFVVRK